MLTFEQRLTYYVAQNNGGEPTPRQSRRLQHKARRQQRQERVARVRELTEMRDAIREQRSKATLADSLNATT